MYHLLGSRLGMLLLRQEASSGSGGAAAQRNPNTSTEGRASGSQALYEQAQQSGGATGSNLSDVEFADGGDGGGGGGGGGGSNSKKKAAEKKAAQALANQVTAGAQTADRLKNEVDMTPEIDEANKAWGDVNQEYKDKTEGIIEQTGQEQQAAIDDYKNDTTATIDALKGLTDEQLGAYAAASGKTIEEAKAQINAVLQGLEGLPDANVGRVDHVDTKEQENILDQLVNSQKEQVEQATDYTVQQGVNELNRAVEDAAAMYQTERNQIASDEERAKANQALYNEMRGDRGGVGQAQYDAIANNAATNQRTVNAEQTKLSTDTARQIADLRAQGEFEKADKLLQISQEYLGQLMELKQWAMETNLGVDEFNIGIDQWENEYRLKVEELVSGMKMNAAQWQAQTELGNQQYVTGQNISAAQNDANLRLNQAETVRQATQNLSQQLAALGLENAENISNALISQITSILDARTNNKTNMVNTEINVADLVGAFSDGTVTQEMWENNKGTFRKNQKALTDALAKAGIGVATKGGTSLAVQDAVKLTGDPRLRTGDESNLAGTPFDPSNPGAIRLF